MYLAGVAALTVSSGAYDWRIGGLVGGSILLISAAIGGRRA